MLLLLEVLAVVLLADLVSGLVHWLEDTFWSEETPLLGRWIVRPNVLHHRDGAAFVRLSWWRSNWDLHALAGLIVGLAGWCELLTWRVWLFAALGASANQLHKWAHTPRRETPAPVRWLQDLHVLQSPAHHAGHHGGRQDTRYCVITELLNPVLDGLGFWRGLERLCASPRNAPRRSDLFYYILESSRQARIPGGSRSRGRMAAAGAGAPCAAGIFAPLWARLHRREAPSCRVPRRCCRAGARPGSVGCGRQPALRGARGPEALPGVSRQRRARRRLAAGR